MSVQSAGGATLTVQPDGSVLASGKNPQADTYKFTAKAAAAGALTGVRLEVLPDPSLPKGGPGRDPDGNFFLSDFEMQIDGKPVIFKESLADESQEGYPAKNVITKREGTLSGWAIDAGDNNSWRRQIVFVPRDPTTIPAGSTLTLTLRHEMKKTSRNIGRFRLSVTAVANPAFVVQVPAGLRKALHEPAAQRTAEAERKVVRRLPLGRAVRSMALASRSQALKTETR